MASNIEGLRDNGDAGMAVWSTNMLKMEEQMDFVVDATFTISSQGKKAQISSFTVDVSVQNTVEVSNRKNIRHELNVVVNRNSVDGNNEEEICSIRMIVEFLYPTHVHICTTIPQKTSLANIRCLQICCSEWFTIWQTYGMTFATFQAGCAPPFRQILDSIHCVNSVRMGTVDCCSLIRAKKQQDRRFKEVAITERRNEARKKMYRHRMEQQRVADEKAEKEQEAKAEEARCAKELVAFAKALKAKQDKIAGLWLCISNKSF